MENYLFFNFVLNVTQMTDKFRQIPKKAIKFNKNAQNAMFQVKWAFL
jgi:hypothetical protein